MNRFFGIKYKQGDQYYITTIMPMKFILENYTVLIYGEDQANGEDPVYGYQRSPKPLHYNKIAKEITKDINSQVTPNSIILGINEDDIEKVFDILEIGEEGEVQMISLKPISNILDIKLRVIDGQHRIKGFEKALSELTDDEKIKKLEAYNTNVIIMVLQSNWRSPEVKVFSNINAKAKPLKMDLTVLAEYKYALNEEPNNMNIENYVIVSVIRNLNFKEFCVEWNHGIILDVNVQKPLGCVGFKAFYDSISSFCKKKIEPLEKELNGNSFIEKKDVLDQVAEEIAEILGKCWNKVFEKWPATKKRSEFDNDENIDIYYDERFYLQRTMGVSAINHIISKCFSEGSGYEGFCKIIDNSKLTLEDWKLEGKFTGLSSMAGVSRIEKAIQNI